MVSEGASPSRTIPMAGYRSSGVKHGLCHRPCEAPSTPNAFPSTYPNGWSIQAIGTPSALLAHDFNDEALVALPVELGVEDSLPGTEVEASGGDRHNHLVMHQ